MIVRPKLHWLRMLFVWNGSVIRAILPQLLVVLCISLFAVWTRGRLFGHAVPLTVAPFTLLGVSLAIFLGFRNSASYDRFWEGRKLWGSLLNVCRSLMRQAQSIGETRPGEPRLHEWLVLLAAFTHAMRHQLRKTDPAQDMRRLLSPRQCEEISQSRYRPALILLWLGQWVAEGKRQGRYGEITAAAMDSNLSALSDILGGCERLAHTPIPYAYSVMNHRVVYLYCFLLPFALVGEIGMMTPVISVLVAYTFIAIEALAQEIEEPFGVLANDLALENMSFNIEDSLRELTGESLPPAAPEPENYVLI